MTVPAYAQYVGPGAKPKPTSVAEILKNPVDDQWVVLRGKLLRQLGDEKFLFSDDSGEIRVEINDDLFRKLRTEISEHTVIEIRGEPLSACRETGGQA